MMGETGGNVLLDVNLILGKAQIGENMKVATLGCGSSGHFVFPAAQLVGKKKGIVYAVDILKTVLERVTRLAKQDNYSNVVPIWSDLEIFNATKIEAGSLDVVLLINILYQSHKRVEILREAIRMLKKDGRVLIVEWKNIASPLGPPVEERVNINLLHTAAPKLGLKLEEEFQAGQFHYGVVFNKL
ncbi:MAG: rRNA (Adenine-N6-)-methyltransferase [Parcubacteria group bacterium GW2011_GWE2_38_18]|nr:MAG: rRNA (Adenine-N6-)-methyltransferase [Parcubacteria group bacterium GW2011_GWE2_38_18]